MQLSSQAMERAQEFVRTSARPLEQARFAAFFAGGAEDAVYQARLGQGRASLLAPDGTLTALLRSGRTLGGIARSLLD